MLCGQCCLCFRLHWAIVYVLVYFVHIYCKLYNWHRFSSTCFSLDNNQIVFIFFPSFLFPCVCMCARRWENQKKRTKWKQVPIAPLLNVPKENYEIIINDGFHFLHTWNLLYGIHLFCHFPKKGNRRREYLENVLGLRCGMLPEPPSVCETKGVGVIGQQTNRRRRRKREKKEHFFLEVYLLQRTARNMAPIQSRLNDRALCVRLEHAHRRTALARGTTRRWLGRNVYLF